MHDQEPNAFSWTAFFLVTSFSFFLFSGALKLLSASHVKEFIFSGIVTLLLGVMNWLMKIMVTSIAYKFKKRNKQFS